MGGGRLIGGLALALAAAACSDGAASGPGPRPAVMVVDSALSIEEALRRFRGGRGEPAGLRGGAPSREALVAGFVGALERRDTAALGRLVLDADEFAWLYYPTSSLAKAPYELPPEIMWMQLEGQTQRGASRLLSERAGAPLGYVDHRCGSERMEGGNRVFGHCELRRVTASSDTLRERLFGLILERDGVYKFVSYSTTLD